MKKLPLIFLLILQFAFVSAQNFPVRITAQATPPYPTNLSGYTNATLANSPLRVQIIFADITATSREVRLGISIEGDDFNATSTSVVVGAPTLILDPGIPLQLSIAELAPYFEQQNLRGISPIQYNGTLPDGRYQFCFEVFDAFNGNRLSAKSCANIFLVNNYPPFLNKPDNKSKITEHNPTNIIFQWTPRHINIPNVSYEFSIVEVWDRYIDPQAVFLSSPPLYQETTIATSLLYGPIHPLLLPGKRYAWRIRAIATNNGEEVAVFTNNGNSEIFWFDYPSPCTVPTNIEVQDVSRTNATISWIGHPDHLDYTVMYRELGSNKWYKKTTPREYITVDEFKPDTVYEYKILGNCTTDNFAESNPKTFRTLSDELAEYTSCGIEPDPVDLSNQELLTELLENTVFTAGDFPVYVKKVSGSGSFTGEGYISTPWLATVRIPVKFKNIKINTDMKLVDGFVITTYDPNWGSIIDADEIIEVVTGDNDDIDVFTVDFVITNVVANENGTYTITGADGQEVIREGGENVVFVDSNGTRWEVSREGDITETPGAEGGAPTSNNTAGMSSNGVSNITATGVNIVFEKGSGYYSFDMLPDGASNKLKRKYEELPVVNGGTYPVPYKAISDLSSHQSDVITAKASFSDSKITKDDIVFKTAQGGKVDVSWDSNGTVATLTLEKKFDFTKEEILATVKPKDSGGQYTIAGTFSLMHLASQEVSNINVKLISVNGASLSGIANRINEIYNPAGIRFKVTQATPISISDTTIDVGDSELLTYYTEAEKAWISTFKATGTYQKDTYYLFVTDIPPSDSSTDGFMPLKSQFGFIFAQNDKGRVAAHELGHGVFGLEHPFTEYDTQSGSTGLLMDYGNGIELNHMDWEKMHAPGIQIYWFQEDEDGQFGADQYLIGNAVIPKVFNQYDVTINTTSNNKQCISFISPANKLISIPISAEDVTFYHTGSLYAFSVLENGKLERYVAAKGKKDGQELFMGYLKSLGESDTWKQRTFQDDFSRYLGKQITVHLGKLKRTKESCGIDLYKKQGYTNNVDKKSWNSGGRKETLIKESLLTGIEPYKTNIPSPEACDLCPEGNKFYNNYSYLIKNYEGSEALFGIGKMICSKNEDKIDYNVLIAQINKDFSDQLKNIFWGSDKALFIKARDKFWKKENAIPLYLKALQRVNKNIKTYNKKLGSNASKEEFYSALYYLNDEFIKTLSFEERISLLEFIFKNNAYITEALFYSDGKDDVSLIKKTLKTLSSDELSSLISEILGNKNIFNDKKEDKEKQRYFLFEIINALGKEALSSLYIDHKLLMLQVLLEDKLTNMFGNNEDAIVTKVVASVKDTEAVHFFDELESSKNYSIDNAPLLYNLKSKLAKLLDHEESYSKFFLELNRLSDAINLSKDGNLDVKTSIQWNVRQRDFALVAFVENNNDFKYQYDENTHTVSITKCVKYEYTYDAKLDKFVKQCAEEVYLLPKGSSPFDLVGVKILNDVSPLASDCRFENTKNELCGKMIVVPAIFLDYLDTNLTIQKWENFGWNVFNVAITVFTLGDGALAIKAVHGAAKGRKVTIALEKSYQLLDFAYTVPNLIAGASQSGPYGCQNETDINEYNACKKKWVIWENAGLAFAVKDGIDLPKSIIKTVAWLKTIKKAKIADFIKGVGLKKYGKTATEKDVLETVNKLEELINKNPDLKREYEQLLAATNIDIPSFKTTFLKKLDGYNEDLTGFKKWIAQLEDSNTSLLQKLDNLGDDVVKFGETFDFSTTASTSKFIKNPDLIDSWNVLKRFPKIITKEGNLEILSKVSSRFEYRGKTSYNGLHKLFNEGSEVASKQNLINGLAEVDKIFDKTANIPVRFSAIKKGQVTVKEFVKVVDKSGRGDEVARYVDGILQKKKTLDDGEVVGNYDGDDILKNGDEVGFRINNAGDGITKIFFKNVDDFARTFDKAGEVSATIRNQAFDLYKQGKWGELETLFKNNNLNGGWPPANGGFNIIDDVPIKAGQKFDRYSGSFGLDDKGNPILGGAFTSPLENGKPFKFGERALNKSKGEYDFYYEIEVLQDLPFKAQNADVIPWFGQQGIGKQSLWDIPKDKITGFPETWNKLAEKGYIKIIIKDSPSGNYNNLVGKTIQK
ncbi:hypothetical protein ATO12_10800 [Aquimarina atlantica]|uniref:Fibronectin type-III domain-containing protein n=1 Tax=Aquimarina atlantica TaxID=1317122 RepID=A0A023BMP8_9FLAO|nr:glycohydrolase toxin TNT-related protein [Aquimarina atlantica]EZH71332.1 hypothetical protein ATO12_10800 [Aquimarina atlantica]